MDIKEKEQTWLSQIDSIFKHTTPVGETECGNITEMKNTLKFLLKKRMRLWWNKASLEGYLLKGLIPRGLRVQVFPSFPVEDTPTRTRWEEACSTCSKSFMELLIGMNKKSIESLDVEINELKTKLSEMGSQANMDTFRKEVDAQYLIWEKEVQEIKTKKFLRDTNDFQSNRVYRWNYTSNGNTQRSRMPSVSSTSSAESTSGWRPQEARYQFRNGKRKGDYAPRQQNERKRTPPPKNTSKLQR